MGHLSRRRRRETRQASPRAPSTAHFRFGTAPAYERRGAQHGTPRTPTIRVEETIMKTWTKPSFKDLRFGMEVTMYILNR